MEEEIKQETFLTQTQLEESIRKILAEEKEEQKRLEEEQQELLKEEELKKQQELIENPPEEIYAKMQLVDNTGNNIYPKNYAEGAFLQGFITIFLLIVLIFKGGKK